MKAILYARFSPRPNADTCESVDDQFSRLRERCKRDSLDIAGEFSDKNQSGDDYDREGIRDAINQISKGYVLVVESLSRLARDIILQEFYIKEVENRGGKVVSIAGEGTENDSLENQTMRKMIGVFNEYHKKVQAQLTSKRMKSKQRQGKRMTRPDRLPYGYKLDGINEMDIIPDEKEQAVLARIIDMREIGLSLPEIAKTLNSEGITSKTGKQWHPSTIFYILKRCA